MAAPTELGTNVIVGIGSYTYTGYIVQSFGGPKPTGEVRKIKDENGATTTVLVADKGRTMSIDMIVKDASDPTTIALGDTITINAVAYRVTDVDTTSTAGEEMTVRIDGEKEDSMTYS